MEQTLVAPPPMQPAMQLMNVACPAGVVAGMQIQIDVSGGQCMNVVVPQGIVAGMQFQVQVPAPPPAPTVVHATPVQPAGQPPMQMPQQTPMQPQMQMQMQPQMHAPVGSGVARLAPFDSLFVKQQIELLEVMTGFETVRLSLSFDRIAVTSCVFNSLKGVQ
eukprot:SAG11_NODE_4017_length_2105_cov_3.338983_3_plen_162_part_00